MEQSPSIPLTLISIAHSVASQAKMDIESVSAIFDFEKETIIFECHHCNGIIPGLSVNFLGHDIN